MRRHVWVARSLVVGLVLGFVFWPVLFVLVSFAAMAWLLSREAHRA